MYIFVEIEVYYQMVYFVLVDGGFMICVERVFLIEVFENVVKCIVGVYLVGQYNGDV